MKIIKNTNKIYLSNNAYNFKKILNIIYKYHITNKRIFFIGNLNKNIKTSLKHTKHLVVNESTKLNGILTNPKNDLKQKKIDLIIAIDLKNKFNMLKESNNMCTPIFFLDSKDFKSNPTNKPQKNIKNINSFICSIATATINKAKITTTKNLNANKNKK